MTIPLADVPQWLSNRLGSEKAWVDGSIAPFLTKEILKGVCDCFLDLSSSIKTKLLLSFLHIVRRNVETLRVELEAVIELAITDSDQWVSLTAEFLRNFPAKGEFNLAIIENADMFHGMRNDIKKHLKMLDDRMSDDLAFLPYEAEYMNRKAFSATFGNAPPSAKHFTLKQKPKSATLRAEALAKTGETSKPRMLTGSSLPIRFKEQGKPDPNAISAATKRAFAAGPQARVQASKEKQSLAAKARGGVKLLDINDTPLGQEQMGKKRRKLVGVLVGGEEKTNKEEEGIVETADKPESPAPKEEPQSPAKNPTSPQKNVASPENNQNNSSPIKSPEIVSSPTILSPSPSPQIILPGVPVDLRNIHLSKDMQERIVEIFKTSNKVTRPEKALIIQFIAGGREHPCPHLGPILTVRLSEHPSKVTLPDGREQECVAEEYFHMNFDTGDWKKIRKNRPTVIQRLTNSPEKPTAQS